jgi:hypothetical protein
MIAERGDILLNPVWAGLRENPEDYGWCSYAAAIGGDLVSRRGLVRTWKRTKSTSAVAREHRMLLFGRGEEIPGGKTAWGGTAKAKGGFSRERIEAELKNGGRLLMWQVLLSPCFTTATIHAQLPRD